MKKLLLLLTLGFSLSLAAQSITVNTTSRTVPELVNNVLINSPCNQASNISWSTGSNFGTTNGIGYFQNTNPNFPMSRGVVLTTGSAQHAGGPNTTVLSHGNSQWPGDSDLENTLAQAGIQMNSTNATVLEFDFLPISPEFSFDFVFASEEYGSFQCDFSDAFAFLLTNLQTGETRNLAVVPGTNTPISVVTIKDFLYNSSCPSQNEQYFGSYNGGSSAATSPTNFNGQTVLMNASATLTPLVPYHIKLVIADRDDHEWDSAIFIAGDSFNIGQNVLGADVTLANGAQLCLGSPYTLDTHLNPAEYTFTWAKDGVLIPGATGPSLTVTGPGNYTVTYDKTADPCPALSDSILVQYLPELSVPNPSNLQRCISGASTYSYNLALNTPVVSAGITPEPLVNYFASEADATQDVNALPSTYTAAPNTRVWVRIQNPQTGCFTVKSFLLEVSTGPVAGVVENITRCARSYTLTNSIFNFNQLASPQVLNGQPAGSNRITYYNSLANAEAATNPISSTAYIGTDGQTIYVRIQNASDTDCYSITSFQIFVKQLPPVDTLAPVIVCEEYTLQPLQNGNYYTGPNGTGDMLLAGEVITETTTLYIYNETGGEPNCSGSSTFLITIIKPAELTPDDVTICSNYVLPGLQYGEYRTEPNGGGQVIPAGTRIDETRPVYYYYTNPNDPSCLVDSLFNVTIIPGINVEDHSNVFECTSYTLPALTVGNYYTLPNGGGEEIPAGTQITSSRTIYIFASTNTEPSCSDADSFYVTIGYNLPQNIEQCSHYTLPNLPAGGKYYSGTNASGEEIPAGTVLTTGFHQIYVRVAGQSGCVIEGAFTVDIQQPLVDTLPSRRICGGYELPALTHGSYYSGPNGTGTSYQPGDIISSNKLIYIYNVSESGCSNQSSFTVAINPPTVIDSRADVAPCNAYVLTPLQNGAYFTGPNGTGTQLPAGTRITESQTIYIYAEGGTMTCATQTSFYIDIFPLHADAPQNVQACDRYVLPSLNVGNYYLLPGGTQTPGNTQLHAGDVITETTTLYVYTESGERINCWDENSFTVEITMTPVVAPMADVKVCGSYTLPELAVGNYYTGALKTGEMLEAGTVLTADTTLYVYAENGACFDEKMLNIQVFNVPQFENVASCVSYQLPALTGARYYTGPQASGVQLQPGSSIQTSQTIYIYAQSPFSPVCYDETSFDVLVVPQPVAHAVSPSQVTLCDEDDINDGYMDFDFTQLNETVLGNQIGDEFVVEYFTSLEDAQNGTHAVTSSNASVVYAKVTNTLAPSCYALRPIQMIVHKLPESTAQNGYMCYDSETETLISPYVIHSGLSSSQYSIEWFNPAGDRVSTNSSYTVNVPGDYTLIATNRTTGCVSVPKVITVTGSEPAELSFTVSESFTNHPDLVIHAEGTGNYEYAIDGGAWQSSPHFTGMGSGLHTVTVRDLNGCATSTIEVMLVNYPHFFTPNADGFNDTWNITDLYQQENSQIKIFDRYGKFITQISPNGRGWDGTFNGQPMPSTDYWFTVNFIENGQEKEFKAHFALKR